jgi:hypothetical protein
MTTDESSFVDLYEVLEIEPDADSNALRTRISHLYLEARDNLEHQNHRKRFYYRELYEIHLPHARLIFLDPEKRAAYDEQLAKFTAQKGSPQVPRKPLDNTKFKAANLPGTAAPAKENFDDFADFSEDNLPLPPPMLPVMQMDPAEVGRRRDVKRRELIKHEIIASGYKWAIGGALVTLFIGLVLLLAVNTLAPGVLGGGDSSPLFLGAYVLIIAALAAFAARQAMRFARRQTVGYLSRLPYDELLRHCGRG